MGLGGPRRAERIRRRGADHQEPRSWRIRPIQHSSLVQLVLIVQLVKFVQLVRENGYNEVVAEWPSVQNPFSTSFGSQPPVLVGRDEELMLIRTGLGSGPGSKHFGTVLVGQRGYGKTVLLGKMREEANEHEWPVIEVNCSTGTALQEIEARGRSVLTHRYGSLLGRIAARVKGGGVSVLGTGAHLDVDLSESGATSFSDLFVTLGAAARENGQGILLLVDEMHSLALQDMRVLAATLQHVTNSLKYPIGYIGAGLPQLEDIIISDDAISFFHRCDRLTLGAIADSDIARGMSIPISQHGGDLSGSALDEAVAYVAGYPYKLQMLGHHLWTVSTDANHYIDEEHLEVAKARVDGELDKHIYGTIWKLVSVPSRNFVQSVMECGGASTLQEVQRILRVSMREVEACRTELASHGLVEHDNGDWVRMTEVIPGNVLSRYLSRRPSTNRDEGSPASSAESVGLHLPASLSDVQPLAPAGSVCGLWMPRKRAYCVLAPGHRGRCRSQVP